MPLKVEVESMHKEPFIAEHPLIQHKVSMLRDVRTPSNQFRGLIKEITELLVYEATRDLPTEVVDIQTPLTIAKCRVIAGRKLAFVPIFTNISTRIW